MNNKLLYFPYIDIPNNNWTIKSILYWDNVGIIVPPDFREEPRQYGKFTVELLNTDLIENVFPAEYIWGLRDFDNSFIRFVDQPKFELAKKQAAYNKGQVSRIHFQKFGEHLLEHLVKLKIAKRESWAWYQVEVKTADLLMLYLATTISKVGGFTAATDSLKKMDTSISRNGISLKRSSIRQRLIDDLMPYPIEPNLSKLRKFKDKYNIELREFRNLLEKVVFETSLIRPDSLQSEKIDLEIAEINDKRERILSDLNQSNLGQIMFGTIFGLVGAVIGFKQENNPSALFSLGNAIYSALQGYGNGSKLDKDYSYLALIDKEFK